MKKLIKTLQVIKKGLLTTFLWAATILGSLFILAFFAIQIPYVQTRIVTGLTKYLSEKTGHEINISYVNISWFDSILLKEINILDSYDSTMLQSQEILIDFSLLDLVIGDDLTLDAVQLVNSGIHLQKVHDSTALNLTYFLNRIQDISKKQEDSTKRASVVKIGKIKLEKLDLSIKDRRKGKADAPWDYNHIHYRNIDCDISDLILSGNAIKARIDRLKADDSNDQLNIRSLRTDFQFSGTSIEFNDLNLKTDRSEISESVTFYYKDPSNLSFFVDSVEVEAKLTKAVIHPGDIKLFTFKTLPFSDAVIISGDLSGKVGRFNFKNLNLEIGSSYLTGFIHMIGLPDFEETFMDIRFDNSSIRQSDIKKFVPEKAHYFFDSLNLIRAKASFLGFINDFVATGYFQTGIGSVNTNLNLKMPFGGFNGSYRGQLEMTEFEAGKILGSAELGHVSMRGSINGSGFDIKTADFLLNAHIDSIELKGYNYQNINTNARFASQLFEGYIDISDPNLNLELDGTIDLRKGRDEVDFTGQIDTLNFHALNLSKQQFSIKSAIDLDFLGLHPDSISGFVQLKNFMINYDNRDLLVDSVFISSSHNEEERFLELQTEDINFKASGTYSNTVVFRDITRLLREYNLILQNYQDSIENYYRTKEIDDIADYEIDLKLSIADADPYLSLFTNNLTVGNNTRINGSLIHGETTILNLYTQMDTLQWGDYQFYNNSFELSSSKMTESPDVLAMMFINSEKQIIGPTTYLDNFFFEAIWAGNNIEFNTNIEQTGADNRARIFGSLFFVEDKYLLKIKPSQLTAIGREWEFHEGNEIIFDKGDIIFKDLQLAYEDQVVNVSGVLSDSTHKQLIIDIDRFELDNINPLIGEKLDGNFTAQAKIRGKGDNLIVQGNLGVTELKMNDFLIGDLKGISTWENEADRLRIEYEVDRLNRKVIYLEGYFYPQKQEQLNLLANFNETSLKVLEPFTTDNFSNIDGSISGEFTIGGALSYPRLKGSGTIKDGNIKINYLNTSYVFDGDLIFDQNEIGVRGLRIRDINNHQAIANGGIFHDGFRNFVLDIKVDMREFQIVNTNSTDNHRYYGTANLTGNVSFLGALSNLKISAQAQTNKGTRIFIPLGETSSVIQQDFIKFVNFSEQDSTLITETQRATDAGVDLRGIQLDFDLDITPDAYTELIFDIKSGDIIRGRGNGKINLQINTDGDFLMFGDFVIVNGGYNFTLKNIINKEFDLIEGSKISWFGDPYQGVMDITAEYKQLTSLLPLLPINEGSEQSRVSESVDARRKYPAVVILNLKGPLLSPEIGFDIRISDYPESIAGYSMGPVVNAFNSKIHADEQELKRQVFSLIVLRRFSPENSFDVGGGQTLGSSVSEFISNQLSYWVSQVDENLEIDVDLTSLDQDAFNTFQLRLAYTFLDGRLKVSRDGGFTDVDNTADISTVVGDWTVEYLITSDGKLRAKMYNKTNYSVINRALGDQNNTTTGFSLQYTKSFDQFRELLFKARKQPKVPKEDQDKKNKDGVIISDGTARKSEGENPRKPDS